MKLILSQNSVTRYDDQKRVYVTVGVDRRVYRRTQRNPYTGEQSHSIVEFIHQDGEWVRSDRAEPEVFQLAA